MRSILNTLRHTYQEVQKAWQFADDWRSRWRLASDFVLYRIIKVISLPSLNHERTIRCAHGVVLTYRLNRGDIQGIREVWFGGTYQLPFPVQLNTVVDLGGNIGLTSVWLNHQYGCEQIIAVEPDAANAKLLQKNFADNHINGKVIEAAIGATDGIVTFATSAESNLGMVSDAENATGQQVKMISMATLLHHLPADAMIDLVKIDIEGGEQALLSDQLAWLSQVKGLIIEFHPDRVDYPGLVNNLIQHGFQYIPPGTVSPNHTDAFLAASTNIETIDRTVEIALNT